MTDLRRFGYFVAVARERNFTRAAERLHIAQPALSRQLRLLEQELGVELVHRTTHDFELTEAGEFLLERGPALLSDADELWSSVRAYGSGDCGAVVIAYRASASYETGPRLLQALAERHQSISITADIRSVTEIAAGLQDGSIDLGLVRCPPRTPMLPAQTIRHERQVLLLRDDHPLASRAAAAVSDLGDETLLLHVREANPGHYDAVLGLCRDQGIEPRILLRQLSFDLRYSPVLQGEAVAIVGESTTSELPAGLCCIPLSPPAALEVNLLARRANRSPRLTVCSTALRRSPASSAGPRPPADRDVVMPLRTGEMPQGSFTLGSLRSTVALSVTNTVRNGPMTSSTDAKTNVQRYFAAVQQGDERAVHDAFAEDASWTLAAGDLPMSGIWQGRDAIMNGFFATAMVNYQAGSIDLEMTAMIAEGDQVVLQWTSRARTRDGQRYENGCVGIFRVRDGKIQSVGSTWTRCTPAAPSRDRRAPITR